MSGKCFPLVGGRVMRVTRLDSCGRPVYGDCGRVISDGFVSIASSATSEDGDEISVTNANGKKCVSKPAVPALTGFELEITFCNVDPDLYAMVTNQSTLVDPDSGITVGFKVNVDVSPEDAGFALEVWSNVPGVACSDDPNAQGSYGYVLWPFVQGGIFGDFTIENDAVSFSVSGAKTKSGAGWGAGPYDVRLDGASLPAPLPPGWEIENGDHLAVFLTELAPPEVPDECGCLPLDNPASAASTGATAGAPGTWTPANSNRPDNFAALVTADPTPTPATTWDSGDYVILEDGSHAYFDGTDWQEGEAP